jgi:VanZ family protein
MQKAGDRSQVTRSIERWALAIVWMGVIFAISAQPKSVVDLGQPVLISKLAHVTEYAILGWLIQRARGKKCAWWQSLLIATVYAATDEFHQSFVPGRNPRVTDVMIDAAGAAIGLAISIRRATPPRSLPTPNRPQ